MRQILTGINGTGRLQEDRGDVENERKESILFQQKYDENRASRGPVKLISTRLCKRHLIR